MKKTEDRTDITEWIIHFVREQDIKIDKPLHQRRAYDRLSSTLDPDISAFTILNYILEVGGLKPGYSLRNGKTTIYGGQPAVCFTEMPIYNFAKYAQARNDPRRCSPYGICILKKELYDAGGRPVIYGLSNESTLLVEDTKYRRIFQETVLPQKEQYRYVAYNPNRPTHSLDWTHEREWRWIADEQINIQKLWLEDTHGPIEHAGLPLFLDKKAGGYFSRVGIIVWNEEEAKELEEVIYLFEDAKYSLYGNPFDKSIISNTFIIMLDHIIEEVENKGNRKANRMEDLLASSSAIYKLTRPSSNRLIMTKVKKAIEEAREASINALLNYLETAPRNSDGFVRDICGFAYVITSRSKTQITKALMELGLATSLVHFYKVDAIGEIPIELQRRLGDKLSKAVAALAFEEARAKAAAKVLTDRLNQKFDVYSVWD